MFVCLFLIYMYLIWNNSRERERERERETVLVHNVCFYSSLFFLINVGVALYYEYYLYSVCFLLLTVTSLYHHSHYTSFSRMIDKIAVYIVVLYGGYLFYDKINNSLSLSRMQIFISVIIVLAFLSTIVLYYYFINCCEDPFTADCYHAFMHCLSSVGHVCIAIV